MAFQHQKNNLIATAILTALFSTAHAATNDPALLLPYAEINVNDQDYFSWYKGEPSFDKNYPVANLSGYFPTLVPNSNPPAYVPANLYTLSGPNNDNSLAGPYFTQIPGNSYGGQLFINQILTPAAFATFSANPNCAAINGDTHKLVCNLTVTANGGKYGTTAILPVILNNGLRALSVEELIRSFPEYGDIAATPNRWDKDNNLVDTTQPYLMEISAQPDDFSTAGTNIVNLNQYFYIPADEQGTVTYSIDGTEINGGTPPAAGYNAVRINGVNAVSPADSLFTINNNQLQGFAQNINGTVTMPAGVYQINIKATTGSGASAETAWQTFYLNVAATNPSLTEWSEGKIATTNVLGKFPSIYVNSAWDSNANTANFLSDYQNYGKDINQINSYLGANKIDTVLAQLMQTQYTFVDNDSWKISHWALQPLPANSNNPADEITAQGIENNRSNAEMAVWMQSIINPQTGAFGQYGLGLTLNTALDNQSHADFMSFNNTQQDILANQLLEPILYASTVNNNAIDGLAFDLEASFNQANSAEAIKKIADRLAYHGKWLNYFAFPEMFNPAVVAAMGPLGVANISTYDIAQYRAPENASATQPRMIPYSDNTYGSAFSSTEGTQLYNAFMNLDSPANGGHCNVTTANNGSPLPQPLPISWCSLSTNDSISENNRRYYAGSNNDGSGVSPAQAIAEFNGKYSPTLPVASTATEWESLEILQPDFSITAGNAANNKLATVMVDNGTQSCAVFSNAYLEAHEADLEAKDTIYTQLENCLIANPANPHDVVASSGTAPTTVQTVSQCGNNPATGKPYAYYQCMIVSNIAGKTALNSDVTHPTEADYDQGNLAVYNNPNASYVTRDNNVGASFYTLQNPQASHSYSNGTINSMVQEPGYAGFNYTSNAVNTNYDPAYDPAANIKEWQAVANVLNTNS